MFNINESVRVTTDGRFKSVVGTVESLHPDLDVEMVYMIKYHQPLSGRGQFAESELEKVN